ncbi:MAG: hypothetical protein JWQ97_989 [Phenylobacterium sp.]|nr:hypothetical protein [Phenylobacterium sp.]
MTTPISTEVLANHTAVLGKTGSGKSSTSRLAVEQVVAAGYRVCIIDAIKSDWWGITSSADGRAPGLPFTIMGGPRGHVPLAATAGAAIGRLVGEGALPLSIVDMAEFGPGDHQRFFVAFADALWKAMTGVLYVVIEEAHEFAPKERAGLGSESMAIHWAKKLATGGRSKGIRLIVATQRVQALHNAVLGSCETLIAHRLTMPADQKPVIDWLKANVDKGTVEAVAGSLSSLPTGTGWLCSGEAKIFEKVAFPKFATFDNTATPTKDAGLVDVQTAPIDAEQLRALLAEALPPMTTPAKSVEIRQDPAKIAEAEARGFERGLAAGHLQGWKDAKLDSAKSVLALGDTLMKEAGRPIDALASANSPIRQAATEKSTGAPPVKQPPAAAAKAPAAGVTPSQQRILNALAWWIVLGVRGPTSEQVGFVAGYAPGSGNFNNLKGGLRSLGLIEYPAPGTVGLTDAGIEKAQAPDSATLTTAHFHAQVRAKLSGPQLKLFEPILAAHPASLSTDEVAAAAGYAAGSGNFNNLRGSLRAIDLIDYPTPGRVRATDWLFPET